MTIRITASEFDTLVLATERPEPIPLGLSGSAVPINPMLFPNDWGFGVRMRTRWITDVTRSLGNSRAERWALSSRPARTMQVSVLGATKDESHALLQSAIGRTARLGTPVPIYCDAVPVTAASPEVVGAEIQGRIYGDFRYRRFFTGGRVCFMPRRVSADRAQNSVIFATVLEVAPDQIRVLFINEQVRAVTTADYVIPCMDVELSMQSRGKMLTDGVYQLELEFTELDGASALPASWPAVTAESAEVLAPLCKIVDGLPVFPFQADWSEGVDLDIMLEGGSDRSGRSMIQEPVGTAYHQVAISMVGKDREASWRIARFFDAMRARMGVFYLIHPQLPWTVVSYPTLSQVSIKAVGQVTTVAFFKRACFVRANGEILTRGISSVTALSGIHTLVLDAPLPDTSFMEVQPILVCSIDQDELEEEWDTDGVMRATLKLREELDHGAQAVPLLGYAEENPGYLAVDGLQMLFRAGAGCLNGRRGPCSVWPGSDAYAGFIQDVSRPVKRSASGAAPLPKEMQVFSTNFSASLVLWQQNWQNNGQPCIRDADYTIPFHTDAGIPIADRVPWGPNGWTLFLCWTPFARGATAADSSLWRLQAPEIDLRFLFDTTGATGAARSRLQAFPGTPGQIDYPLTYDLSNALHPVMLTMRIDSQLRFWVNGQQARASATGFSLPTPSSFSISRWFNALWTNRQTTSSILASEYGVTPGFNVMASYNRALDISEINQIQLLISDTYRTPLVSSLLY